jgi:acetoacetyl-CoA synthetase
MTPIWRPSAQRAAAANIARFMACVNARHGWRMAGYGDLYRWSIGEPAQFWTELARFADVRATWAKEAPVIDNAEQMPGARFFSGARLNFAENLLRYRDSYPALVFRNERGARRELSYRQLCDEVARVAAGLKAAGVVSGDRNACHRESRSPLVILLARLRLGRGR